MGKEFLEKLHPFFEDIDMYGKVVNVSRSSAGINTFFLKWYITRVTDGMPLREYPFSVNTTPSNDNKILLQTDIIRAITVEYRCSSHQSSMSRSASGRQRTQNQQHQEYEDPGLPLFSGRNRPSRRARTNVEEENESQYGSDIHDGTKSYEDDNAFHPHNKYASDEEDNSEKDVVI